MGANKKITYLVIYFLVLVLVFPPISFSKTFSSNIPDARAADDRIISGYEEWKTNQEIDGYVLIESGATLVIKSGVTVTFKGSSSIDIEGKLISKGTRNNPVKFKREGIEEIPVDEYGDIYEYEGYAINIYGEANFKNTEIQGGGNVAPYVAKNNNIINTAYAYGESGAIQVFGSAKLTMNACNLHDNAAVIYLSRTRGENIKVNRTLFNRNIYFDERDSSLQGSNYPDFRYNWWRNPNGPEKTGNSYNPYKYISNRINSSSWLALEYFHDPVIIIPGILGSEKVSETWQIDPIFHTYDNLYEEFSSNGYVPEEDLFTFPYDWRKSNVENADLLRLKINEIRQQKNWPKVDLVAHSMGGLLAREYIESDNYQDDVDQLVTLGTPNNGAPEAYLKWEAGAFTFSPGDLYLKIRFSQEAKENGFDNIFHYIRGKIPSVKELLPVYGYLYNVEDNNNLIAYNENNYPINTFLESLNSATRKEKLLNVELDKIIGNVGSASSTTSGFNIINADMGEYWIHGYPHGFENPLGDRGMTWGIGDRTVPLDSAKSENILADDFSEINSVHRELPTNAQKEILKLLTGKALDNEVKHSLIRDMLIVSVYSPVDIQVVGPNGRVGKDFVTGEILNEIPGSFYSGYGTENEFLTIPISNSQDRDEYQILTQGTGEGGSYQIGVARISEQENSPEAEESVAIIEGTAQAGIIDYDNKVEIAGDKVINPNQTNGIAYEVTIISPEEKIYQNNESVPIEFAVNGSQLIPENITTEKFLDGKSINDSEIDLALQHLENHTLKIIAKDESQNQSEKEINFQIAASIDSIIDNVEHYAALGLIKNRLEKKLLHGELGKIKRLFELMEEIEKNPRFPARAKTKLIEIAAQNINHNIDIITKYIQKRTGKAIDSQAAELLIESLEYIKL